MSAARGRSTLLQLGAKGFAPGGARVSELNVLDHITIELNPRERRLYDRLLAKVIERRPAESSGVRDLILLLPDLTVLLMRLMRDPRVR